MKLHYTHRKLNRQFKPADMVITMCIFTYTLIVAAIQTALSL